MQTSGGEEIRDRAMKELRDLIIVILLLIIAATLAHGFYEIILGVVAVIVLIWASKLEGLRRLWQRYVA